MGLDQSKLRRVAFCVDVEIASGPRYIDSSESDEADEKKKEKKKRAKEKSEGDALKNPTQVKEEKEQVESSKPNGELPDKFRGETSEKSVPEPPTTATENGNKKKEKKKRSEEERKARKEKKRRLAEANGTIPVELERDPSDSSLASIPHPAAPKTHTSPTTDPVRIYRRCCQLRETPILKRIVEQLAQSVTTATIPGLVNRLDLSGYRFSYQTLSL